MGEGGRAERVGEGVLEGVVELRKTALVDVDVVVVVVVVVVVLKLKNQ